MGNSGPSDNIETDGGHADRICSIVQWTALAAAVLLGAALAWRTITGADIGCHLAYGEHLLDTGEIVDSNMFIYTDVRPAGASESLDFPPGSWLDDTGRFRFPNANWGSELIMAIAYRAGDPAGLCTLQAVLVAAMLVLVACAMLGGGVRPWAAAIGVAIVAMAAQARFMHRPELFGYVLLAAQLYVLMRPRFGKFSLAALILLQVAFVQVHSSWALGIALTLCFFVDGLVRTLWSRFGGKVRDDRPGKRLGWCALALVGQALAGFVSPWGWRTAVLPIQTMWYLQANNLMPGGQAGSQHPWATIRELLWSLSPVFAGSATSKAFVAALCVAGIGAAAAIVTRRWSILLLVLGMGWLSLKIRRNIAPGVVIIVPAGMVALQSAAAWARDKWRIPGRLGRWPAALAAAVTVAACLWWIVSIVTNSFYYNQAIRPRFGASFSKIDLPIEAGRYVRSLKGGSRIFTTFSMASNVLYFSRGETGYRELPLLGNGWAYPPRTAIEVARIAKGDQAFGPFAEKHNVGIVVLRVDRRTAWLAKTLQLSGQWAVRHVGARTVVFVSAALDSSPPPTIDSDKFIAELEAMDPCPAYPLQAAARTLEHMGWYDLAIRAGERAVEIDPEYAGVWDVLGVNYALRATALRTAKDPRFAEDFRQAKRCFTEALKRDPDSQDIPRKLRQVNKSLREISQ